MKHSISNLPAKNLFKEILLCSVFILGINELAKAGTADDPPPPIAPPVTPATPPPPPPPPSPPNIPITNPNIPT